MLESDIEPLPGYIVSTLSNLDNHLRYKSRFRVDSEIEQKIEKFIGHFSDFATITLAEGTLLRRARAYPKFKNKPFKAKEMGAPPPGLAGAGRMSPAGMPVLYLANSVDVAISEIKPWSGANVAVGNFKLIRSAKVLDLTKTSNPDRYQDESALFLHNMLSESMFSGKLSENVHPDDDFSYISTQYISDLIRQKGYDGLIFMSGQVRGGKNFVFFDVEIAKCNKVRSFKICSLMYKYSPLAKLNGFIV